MRKPLHILMAGNSELVIFGFRGELVQRLVAEGHRVTTVFPVTEFGSGRESAARYGCDFEEIRINGHGKNPIEDAALFFHYLALLRRKRPDVLLTFTIKPNVYAGLAARMLGIPVIANITGVGVAIEHRGPVRFAAAALYRAALKQPTAVFFQNTENMALFDSLKIAPERRILLPGSGVNLERFSALPYPDDAGGVHFLFIARIMKKKGIRYYLDAAKAIRAGRTDVTFHILGAMSEPEYEPEIRAHAAEGTLVYHGLTEDVRPFLRACHCVIHPTYYPEGMSNVLLESFASARPAIATDRAGCREIIDDGINGYLCRERDSESLIRAIETFLALDNAARAAMGQRARRKAESAFDRNIVVEQYLTEIDRACKGGKNE